MQRRDFLKLSATAGAVSCVTACGGKSGETETPVVDPSPITQGLTQCLPNCGTYCPLVTKVQDGRLVGIEAEEHDLDSDWAHKPCLRGRSNVQRQYHPDRVLYPMKRVGKRGGGQFERISWEQAISEISEKLKAQYAVDPKGRGIFLSYGYIGQSVVNNKRAIEKVLHDNGGFTYNVTGGGYSLHQFVISAFNMFGTVPSSTMSEVEHSDMIVSFGLNVKETHLAGHQPGYVFNRLSKGKKVIVFDPKFTDSIEGSHEHYFIRPGTDSALCEAMAYVLIQEDGEAQVDTEFMKNKCYGYDAEEAMPNLFVPGQMLPPLPYEESYKAHILGDGTDGTSAKTPEWAAPICGIPADTIRDLARRIASADAPFIVSGAGLQRQHNGVDQCGAIAVFNFLVGGVGKRGTNATASWPGGAPTFFPRELDHGVSHDKDAQMLFYTWAKAIKDGENVTVWDDGLVLPADELDENGNGSLGQNLKILITHGGNPLNQHGNADHIRDILCDESLLDMHLVIENHMSSTAKVADYILPDASNFERQDLLERNQGYNGNLVRWTATQNELKPLGECKPTWEIARLLAEAMGTENSFTQGLTYEETLEKAYQQTVKHHIDTNPMLAGGPSAPANYEEFRKVGRWEYELKNDLSEASARLHCGLYDYVSGGAPLGTFSGKISIYNHNFALMATRNQPPEGWPDPQNRFVNAIPKYFVTLEGFEDKSEELKEYPLQCYGFHGKGQAHSFYWNVPWVRESSEHCVWVNPKDAPQGAKSGDLVIVESRRGKIQIRLKITPRMMPSVVSLPQGAWYNPQNGVDVGGCMNTLVQSEQTCPKSFANPSHTNRVKIYKA